MQYPTQKNRRGFSLLEVLVAASIILVLTAVGVTSYVSITRRSRDARRISDIEQIRQALEMYRSENGYYPGVNPGSFGDATALGPGVLVPTFMPAIPTDPKASPLNPYKYQATNLSGSNYYGYCLAALFEAATGSNGCSGTTLPAALPSGNYNYGARHP
jgi:prepilin-type N-terminal cleavage/methylation domain-containing protein